MRILPTALLGLAVTMGFSVETKRLADSKDAAEQQREVAEGQRKEGERHKEVMDFEVCLVYPPEMTEAERRRFDENFPPDPEVKVRFPDCLLIESSSLKHEPGMFGEYVEMKAHDLSYRYVLRGGSKWGLVFSPGTYQRARRSGGYFDLRVCWPADKRHVNGQEGSLRYLITHLEPR